MAEKQNVGQERLRTGLMVLRVTTGLFFLVWSFDKILNPDHTISVFETFYFTSISSEVSLALGVIQALIVLAFILGVYKTWTTGALLVMHTVSVASSWQQLINPYEGPAILFWAAVPVWGGLLLLWLARDADVKLTLSPRK